MTSSMVKLPYRNRVHAGEVLAEALGDYAGVEGLVVLGLPRGGAIVAAEVARRLGGSLDVVVVRKLGMPGQEELAMGALASGGMMVVNREVADMVSDEVLAAVAQREHRELERRERAYRGGRPPAAVADRSVILVDDGLATGATMRAAVAAVRERGAARAVVAVPVAPSTTIERLRAEADEVICPATPELFFGIGQFYADFSQTSDEDVTATLEGVWGRGDESAQRV